MTDARQEDGSCRDDFETHLELSVTRAAIADAGLELGDVLPVEGGLLPSDGDQVDISELVALAAPAIYDPWHERDSLARGRAWATAVEGVPGPLAVDYASDVARTRWQVETVLATTWDRLREHFYAEYEADQGRAV